LLWFLGSDSRLGANADSVLQDLASSLVLPAIVLAEACWIVEHGRSSLSIAALLDAIDQDPRITIFPLDRIVIERSNALTNIDEMHDRQIVATALVLKDERHTVTLLTKDANIIASKLVAVVW
jgi:PIN domain nuclease of toxin-antitoxin system